MARKRNFADEFLDRLFEAFQPTVEVLQERLMEQVAAQAQPAVPLQPGICQCQYFGKVGPGPCRFCGRMFDPPKATKPPKSPKSKPAPKQSRQKPAKVETLYEILGVSPNCPPQVLMAAWKAVARMTHPDVAGPKGEERMKAANAAYEVLSDPAKRREYDRWLGNQ